VYFASAAPPIRYPNVYGIDMPSTQELIATGRTVEQVASEIGADRVIYQDLDDLIEAAREGNPRVTEFDTSCFDGVYVTGTVRKEYLDHIERIRSDVAKCASTTNDLVSTELHTYY
jgi:amidophosphoribosyltransferase